MDIQWIRFIPTIQRDCTPGTVTSPKKREKSSLPGIGGSLQRVEEMRKNDTNGMAEDLRAIREFLEFAKSSIQRGVALKEEFGGFSVVYDGYWTRFRVVDDSVRCQIPEDTSMITKLPECARNCWKLLMFRRKPEDIEASINLLIPLLKSGEIKSFKHNGDRGELKVVRYDSKKKTLAPTNEEAYVIVIYTWGTEERDGLKAKLHSIGFTNIPYRRGCKMFEKNFGHWKQWFKDEK